jgi:hypothetical protein
VEQRHGDELVGAAPTSRRSRAVVWLVLTAVLVGVGLDRWQVERERTALLDAVVVGEQTVGRSSAELRGLRAYVGPLTSNVDARPAARQWAFDVLREQAAGWRPRVRAARAEVQGVPVASWHGDVRAAQEAYAERLATWDELLGGFGRRGQGSGAAARSAAERARSALLAAGTDADRVHELLGRGEAGTAPRR